MKRKISLEEIDTLPSKKIWPGPFDTPPDSPTLAPLSQTKPPTEPKPSSDVWGKFEDEEESLFLDEIEVPHSGKPLETANRKDAATQTDDVLIVDKPAATHRRRTSTGASQEESEPTRAESRLAIKVLTDQAQAPGAEKLTVEQLLRQDIWVTNKLKDKVRKFVKKRHGDPKEVRAVKIFIEKR